MNLELERYEISTAYSGREALEQFCSDKPDIVLLDISLPDMEGNEILEQMKMIDHTVPVIMVTARDKMHSKILSLQLGADDYITKPFNLQELILRIQVVARYLKYRESEQSQSAENEKNEDIIRIGNLILDRQRMKVTVSGVEVAVTYKEFQTLLLLCREKGVVISRDKLLSEVWGFDFEGNSRSVDIMIARLRKKLGEEGNRIKTIYGAGYRYEV